MFFNKITKSIVLCELWIIGDNELAGLLTDSFFDGVEEFVEFEKLFVHVERGVLELLDFLGAVGEDEGQGGVGRRWRELWGCLFCRR